MLTLGAELCCAQGCAARQRRLDQAKAWLPVILPAFCALGRSLWIGVQSKPTRHMRLSTWDRRPLARRRIPVRCRSASKRVRTTMNETAFQPTIEAIHKGRAALEADPHRRLLSLTQGRIG